MNNQNILKRDNYTCQKCGYINNEGIGLEVHHINPNNPQDLPENLITLCSICHNYAPDEPRYFKKYVNEKIDGKILNTFRNNKWSIGERTRFGMDKKARDGGFVNKAPLGYKFVNKKLEIDPESAEKVRIIFNEFLNNDISLTKLAKKNGMTTSGMIKLLQNRTYLGVVKFGEEYKGTHTPIIDQELFDKVQEKLSGK
ncbi:recombinase family protein [Candidatus Woesearchaeota archaeon]|nr:recombinase family protein [Candidatus Woesearchaeota archaeon]HIJ01936.1 hypothetical protein [Candidatus Woesearchaeota archaeon]